MCIWWLCKNEGFNVNWSWMMQTTFYVKSEIQHKCLFYDTICVQYLNHSFCISKQEVIFFNMGDNSVMFFLSDG